MTLQMCNIVVHPRSETSGCHVSSNKFPINLQFRSCIRLQYRHEISNIVFERRDRSAPVFQREIRARLFRLLGAAAS